MGALLTLPYIRRVWLAWLATLLVCLAFAPSASAATPDFDAIYQRLHDGHLTLADGTRVLPKNGADKFAVVFVDGFMGHAIDRLPKTGYFGEARRAFRNRDYRVVNAPIDTLGELDENVETLRATIVKASRGGRDVILVGHSYGGAVIEATLGRYPDLDAKVRLNVVFNSAARGSELADLLVRTPPARAVANLGIRALGGKPRILDDLTVAKSAERAATLPRSRVPTVAVTSSPTWRSPAFLPSKVLSAAFHMGSNDLLVSNRRAVPEGAAHWSIAGTHGAAVVPRVLGIGAPGARTAEHVVMAAVAGGLRLPDARRHP